MDITPRCLEAVACALLAAAPLSAHALEPTVETGLEVTGLVDLDSTGPLPPQSSKKQSVELLPLPVSQIDIADAAAGLFSYSASADIGLLELKVFGSLTNASAGPLGNGETPLMRVSSEVRDVLTFSSSLTTPYTVTFEIDVDGGISGSGSAVGNAFLDFGVLGAAHANDSGAYFTGPIGDTLSVSRQVSGASVQMDFTALLSFAVFSVAPGSTLSGALDRTASMRVILPDGVSLVASDSGTFGVPIPAVPEPATWALWLAGLGALARLARSRVGGASAGPLQRPDMGR